jgi:hypothetical protein
MTRPLSENAKAIIKSIKTKHGNFPGAYVSITTFLPLISNDQARTTSAINELLNADFAVKDWGGDAIALTRIMHDA